jgi:hypothetical protein
VAESPQSQGAGVAELEPDRQLAGGGAWLRRRSTLWALAVAVVAAVAIIVNVVVLTNNGPSSVTPAAVVLAGQLTAQQPGFRYAMTSSTTVDGQHILLTASGNFDEAAPISGSTTVTVQGRTFKERLLDTDIYIQSPTSSNSWYRVNYHSLLHALGPSAPLETNSDPADWLTSLQGAAQVTDLGIEKIRGVPTTHYNAVIDLAKLAKSVPAGQRVAAAADAKLLERLTGKSSFTVDVWVDVANLVRQLEMSLPVKTAAGTVVEFLSMQMFDYGLQPQAQRPPAKDVTDLRGAVTSKIAQQLQALTS